MFDKKIHRIWVINDDEKPIGLVTMSDILLNFVPVNEGNEE